MHHLHGMQLFVKHEIAWRVMASGGSATDNPRMPPVKKKPRVRRSAFFKEWREFREFKQYEGAERIGVDPATMSRLESGKTPYDQDILEKLALAYRCEPGDLLRVNPLKATPLERAFSDLGNSPPDVQTQVARYANLPCEGPLSVPARIFFCARG